MTLSSHISVMVVEDQPSIRENVCMLVEQHKQFKVIAACGSVREARELIPLTKPKLLLLDVSLPDGTAFEIFQEIPPDKFYIIFLTAYEHHAIKAIKYGALDYILKPLDKAELMQALDKVLKSKPAHTGQIVVANSQYADRAGDQNDIVLRSHQSTEVVTLKDITHCRSYAGYTTFYLQNGRQILASRHLKEFAQLLPSYFLRSHKSYLVNGYQVLKYQKHFSKDSLILKTGMEIPVASRQKKAILDYVNKLSKS